MRRQSARGLSLVEVAVVLVVLGLVLAAVSPSVMEWMQNLAVRNAGESIKAGMERARVEALRRNTRMGFWLVDDAESKTLTDSCRLSTSGPSWVVSGADPAGLCASAPSMTQLPRLVESWAASDGARQVRVRGQDADGNPSSGVEFSSLGQAFSADGQLARVNLNHQSDPENAVPRLQVLIEAGGGVRMCDPSAGLTDPRRC